MIERHNCELSDSILFHIFRPILVPHRLDPVRFRLAGATIAPDLDTVVHAFAHRGFLGCGASVATYGTLPGLARLGLLRFCIAFFHHIWVNSAILPQVPPLKAALHPMKKNAFG